MDNLELFMNKRSTSNLRPNQNNSVSRFMNANQNENSLQRLVKTPLSNSGDRINYSEQKKLIDSSIHQKLAYEWKNIYRNLIQFNNDADKNDN